MQAYVRIRGHRGTNPRSTITGNIWKMTCSRKVFIEDPLLSALRTSPVFLFI
jgi:hypothetical protein